MFVPLRCKNEIKKKFKIKIKRRISNPNISKNYSFFFSQTQPLLNQKNWENYENRPFHFHDYNNNKYKYKNKIFKDSI